MEATYLEAHQAYSDDVRDEVWCCCRACCCPDCCCGTLLLLSRLLLRPLRLVQLLLQILLLLLLAVHEALPQGRVCDGPGGALGLRLQGFGSRVKAPGVRGGREGLGWGLLG